MSEEITQNKVRLVKLEKIIAKNEEACFQFYEAFSIIKEEKLYKPEFQTFEEYCQKRWNRTLRAIQKQIKATEIKLDLLNRANHGSPSQKTEAQEVIAQGSDKVLLELGKEAPENRLEVLQQSAKETGGKPTGRSIKEIMAKVHHKPNENPPPGKPRGGLGNEAIAAKDQKAAENEKEKMLEALEVWWGDMKKTMAYSAPTPKMCYDGFKKLIQETL